MADESYPHAGDYGVERVGKRYRRVPYTYLQRKRETARRESSAQAYETLKAPSGGTKGPVDTDQKVLSSVDTDSRPMVFGRDKMSGPKSKFE